MSVWSRQPSAGPCVLHASHRDAEPPETASDDHGLTRVGIGHCVNLCLCGGWFMPVLQLPVYHPRICTAGRIGRYRDLSSAYDKAPEALTRHQMIKPDLILFQAARRAHRDRLSEARLWQRFREKP